jgi:hypothetical protein
MTISIPYIHTWKVAKYTVSNRSVLFAVRQVPEDSGHISADSQSGGLHHNQQISIHIRKYPIWSLCFPSFNASMSYLKGYFRYFGFRLSYSFLHILAQSCPVGSTQAIS